MIRLAHNRASISGERFGRLVAVSDAGNRVTKSGKLRAIWNCMCDCGERVVVDVSSLRSGNTKSCGCLVRKSNIPEYAEKNAAVNSYKQSAKKRGYEWLLSDDVAIELMLKDCFYCGSPSSNGTKVSTVKSANQWLRNGIDRIDPSGSYQLGNVVPCCKACNVAKASMTKSEFIGWATKVAVHSAHIDLTAPTS